MGCLATANICGFTASEIRSSTSAEIALGISREVSFGVVAGIFAELDCTHFMRLVSQAAAQ